MTTGHSYFEFVALLFPFQLTSYVEYLSHCSSCSHIKYPVPGLVKGIKLGIVSPLFLLYLHDYQLHRLTDEYSKPMSHTSSDSLCDLYVLSQLTSLYAMRRGARMKTKKKRIKVVSAVCRPKRCHSTETSLACPLLDCRL